MTSECLNNCFGNYIEKHEINNTKSCYFIQTTPAQILIIINGPENKLACQPKSSKEVDSVISTPLALAINKCMQEGIFTQLMKWARMVPIYKKDDANLKENYRPISILPVLFKIFGVVIEQTG